MKLHISKTSMACILLTACSIGANAQSLLLITPPDQVHYRWSMYQMSYNGEYITGNSYFWSSTGMFSTHDFVMQPTMSTTEFGGLGGRSSSVTSVNNSGNASGANYDMYGSVYQNGYFTLYFNAQGDAFTEAHIVDENYKDGLTTFINSNNHLVGYHGNAGWCNAGNGYEMLPTIGERRAYPIWLDEASSIVYGRINDYNFPVKWIRSDEGWVRKDVMADFINQDETETSKILNRATISSVCQTGEWICGIGYTTEHQYPFRYNVKKNELCLGETDEMLYPVAISNNGTVIANTDFNGPVYWAAGNNGYYYFNDAFPTLTQFDFTRSSVSCMSADGLTIGGNYDGKNMFIVYEAVPVLEKGIPTSIQKSTLTPVDDRTFLLDGRTVNEAQLGKGLYIKNGKKFMVK